MSWAQMLPSAPPFPVNPPDEDAETVEAVRRKDLGAERRFFDAFAPMVERVVVHTIGPDLDVPDLIQDVFSKALVGLGRLKEPQAVRGWLASIAVFTSRTYIRRRALRRKFEFFVEDQSKWEAPCTHDPEATEALRVFYSVLDRLSADLRMVFVLRHLEQMQNDEIATAIGKSTMTVKRRAAKAETRFFALASKEEALVPWLQSTTWRQRWNRETNDSQS
jgi:RNA polymerase sigma-70 factor, ECF subfamily